MKHKDLEEYTEMEMLKAKMDVTSELLKKQQEGVMKKLTMSDQTYIKEMEIWSGQRDLYSESCWLSIEHCEKEIRNCKRIISLERLQLKIRFSRRVNGVKQYNMWRKKKGLKPIK